MDSSEDQYKKDQNWEQPKLKQTQKEPLKRETLVRRYNPQEAECYMLLMNDSQLKKYVTDYKERWLANEVFAELDNPLAKYDNLMKVKLGYRSFSLEDIEDKKVFEILYNKMIQVDPNELNSQEMANKAITKCRYRKWRDRISSTVDLAFRIEKVMIKGRLHPTNLITLKEVNEIENLIGEFTDYNTVLLNNFLKDLESFVNAVLTSNFLTLHEMIGSSLLFVYENEDKREVKMINFERIRRLPQGVTLTHLHKWTKGSQEDGYLRGVLNLIQSFQNVYIKQIKKELK